MDQLKHSDGTKQRYREGLDDNIDQQSLETALKTTS